MTSGKRAMKADHTLLSIIHFSFVFISFISLSLDKTAPKIKQEEPIL